MVASARALPGRDFTLPMIVFGRIPPCAGGPKPGLRDVGAAGDLGWYNPLSTRSGHVQDADAGWGRRLPDDVLDEGSISHDLPGPWETKLCTTFTTF